MKPIYILEKSTRKDKKYMVTTPHGLKIHFGAQGYEDYTIHQDLHRKENYISRHQKRENWSYDGIKTAGWWSRWLLWNLPDFDDSLNDIERRFPIIIKERI